MRLNQRELLLMFADVSLTNDVSGCKRILTKHLQGLGYRVYPGYRVKATGDLIDVMAYKPDHNMAIVIGRKYPRKKKLLMLSKIEAADNRVFLMREGNSPYEYLHGVDCIDVNMSESLHSRSSKNYYSDYDRDHDVNED